MLITKRYHGDSTLSRALHAQNYFHNVISFFFYFICTAGTKTLVSRTASVLAQIKTVALNCTNSHCVLYFQALTVKKKISFT